MDLVEMLMARSARAWRCRLPAVVIAIRMACPGFNMRLR